MSAPLDAYLAASPSPSEMEDSPARNDDLVAASALYQCDECIAEEREFSCHQIEDVVIVNGKVVCKDCVAEFYPKARTERAPDIAAKLRRQRMSVAQEKKRAGALSEENEALRKERDEAQANAYRSDKAADALNVAVKDAGDRAAAMWRQFRDLRTEIIGDGPMCRDCADFDGRCQGNGPPCDPDEAAKEKLATWKAAETRIKALEEALTPSAATKAAYIGEFFERVEIANPMHEGNEDDEPETIVQSAPLSWTTIKEIMAAIRSRALGGNAL